MQKNLTGGSVFKNLIYFSLPYLLSYFLQTLYGMADLFIIGKFGSVADVTAVAVGSQVMHMLTVMIVGLAMGTTVTISRFVGAENKRGVSQSIGNSAVVFIAASAVLTAVLLALLGKIVSAMSTPAEAVGGTSAYLKICFIGIPFITAYNVISSVFRGMGDSKSPMYFIAAACAANIVLDFIFMGALKMGPAGAALGTTLSQTISVIISLVVIIKRDMGIDLKKTDFKPSRAIMSQLLKIGVPISLQDGFIQISFIVITVIANRRGLTDSAAVGIVEKLISIFFLVPSSMLSAVSALAAQNIGAGKLDRARKTLWYAMSVTVSFGFVIALISQFFANGLVGIFEDDPSVIISGAQYLKSYVWDCIFAGVHFCFSGYFCAMERSGISFLHNFLSIVAARIPLSYLASVKFPNTLYPMGFAAPVGSVLSVVICLCAYFMIKRAENRRIIL